MKKPFIMLMMSSCLLLTPSMAQVVVNDPVATSQAVITCGNARFTVLTPEMIRVEYSDKRSLRIGRPSPLSIVSWMRLSSPRVRMTPIYI